MTTATSTWLRVSIARSQLSIAAMPTSASPHSSPKPPAVADPAEQHEEDHDQPPCSRLQHATDRVEDVAHQEVADGARATDHGHAVAEVLVQPVDRRLCPRSEADAPRREVLERRAPWRRIATTTTSAKPTTHCTRRSASQPGIGRPCFDCRSPVVMRSRAIAANTMQNPAEKARLASSFCRPCQHLATDVAGTDLRRDHDDAEGHHDHLVEAEQELSCGPTAAAPCRAVASRWRRTTDRPRSTRPGPGAGRGWSVAPPAPPRRSAWR